MLFNSIDFAIFFSVVFVLYWFVVNRNLKLQNLFIVIAGFTFYGWWDLRFLSLLFASCIINYIVGYLMSDQIKGAKRKILIWFALIYNLGLLVVFKYLNFFIESFISAFTFMGYEMTGQTLNIVLPVGISFFTFQALGYLIEVFRKNITPTKDIINFSAFMCFFPLILAGPIERATGLLPQFKKKRTFDYSQATDGLKQILWGLFKKIVIADNCAVFANIIFINSEYYSGSTLVLGAMFYTIQIYADFSGYSDIAIGVSRLLGFDVIQNFNFPYLSLNVADFWRRWHISLSSWLRDYLYTPLSIKIRNYGKGGIVFSLLVTFLLCGLWHGANYTFIVWGGLHGLALGWDVISVRQRRMIRTKTNPAVYNIFSWFITMGFIVFTWIIFRAENIEHAIYYCSNIFTSSLISIPYIIESGTGIHILPKRLLFVVCFFIYIEWLGRNKKYAIEKLLSNRKIIIRWVFYLMIILMIFYLGNFDEHAFIYFQF